MWLTLDENDLKREGDYYIGLCVTCSLVKQIIKELLVKQVADPWFEPRAFWEEGSTNYLSNEPD